MERNVTLDYFKIMLSMLVITIHIGPLSVSNPLINWLIQHGISRIAVPCFFIINGYYFFKKVDNGKAVRKYLLHLILIYTVWTVFYVLAEGLWENSPLELLSIYIFGFFHLWYVPSLFWGCLILFLIKKKWKNDTAILIFCVLILLIAAIDSYRQEPALVMERMALGFPFVFFGYYIRSKNLMERIKNSYLIPIIILGFVTLCIEACVFSRLGTGIYHNIFYSLIILCPAIIIYIFKHGKYKKSDRNNSTYLLYLGSLPSAIYFIHKYSIYILSDIYISYMLIRFIIVLFISIILSIFIIYINKYIKIFL